MDETTGSPSNSVAAGPPADFKSADDAVWTYRGYRMRPAEFNTAWVHYYRAEIQRSNTWRTRLDSTTNWAVVAVAGTLTFVLANSANHYGIIPLSTVLVTLFAWIEARRYRYYELWSYRARLLETNFFAAMLIPPFSPDPGWAEELARSLRNPRFTISIWEAFGRRLRRNYLWIYVILALAWALKSYIHPTPATSWTELIARSAVGPLSGEVMLAFGLMFNGALFVIALLTARLHRATGEIKGGSIFHSDD